MGNAHWKNRMRRSILAMAMLLFIFLQTHPSQAEIEEAVAMDSPRQMVELLPEETVPEEVAFSGSVFDLRPLFAVDAAERPAYRIYLREGESVRLLVPASTRWKEPRTEMKEGVRWSFPPSSEPRTAAESAQVLTSGQLEGMAESAGEGWLLLSGATKEEGTIELWFTVLPPTEKRDEAHRLHEEAAASEESSERSSSEVPEEEAPEMTALALGQAREPARSLPSEEVPVQAASTARANAEKRPDAWYEADGKRYYVDREGNFFRNQIIRFGSKVAYYMGSDGSVQYGFVRAGGKLYFADPTTGQLVQTPGWMQNEQKRYYIGEDGTLFHDQVITFGASVAYYMGSDGSVQYGFVRAGDKLYFADPTTGQLVRTPGWVHSGQKRYYVGKDGTLFHDQVITFGSSVAYYTGSDGSVQHGLVRAGDKLYFAHPASGELVRTPGWVTDGSDRYYVGEDGALFYDRVITFGPSVAYCMDADGRVQYGLARAGGRLYFAHPKSGELIRTPGWFQYGQKRYYLREDGSPFHDQVITFGSDTLYYVNSDGSIKEDAGLVTSGSDKYYVLPGGVFYRNRFASSGAATYYFGENGRAAKGAFCADGSWYFFDLNTAELVKREGWVQDGAKKYYVGKTGLLFHNQVITFGAQTAYFMGADASVQYGVVRAGSVLYFADPVTGKLDKSPGWRDYGGKRYYVSEEGTLFQNQMISFGPDVKYYMGADGSMQTGSQFVNGAWYFFDEQTGQLRERKQVLVMDVSYWQNPDQMDFDRISRQIGGVILRIGYTGTSNQSLHLDSKFDRFYKEFRARQIPIGAYWYSCADTPEKGRQEALFLIEAMKNRKFELPIYWDTEDAVHQSKVSAKQLTDTGLAFLDTLRSHRYYAGVYASAFWLRDRLQMSRLSDYEVWVAHYGADRPAYDGSYGMWQYTSEGRLDGYASGLDLSWLYKDYPSIIKKGGWNGY